MRKLVIGFVALTLVGCGADNISGPGHPEFDNGVKTGQLATVVQIIDQANKAPCQTINLFNKSDADNLKEVNLINVACESLNLPDINQAPDS